MSERSNNLTGRILDVVFAGALMIALLVSLNIALFYVPGNGGFAYPKLPDSSASVQVADSSSVESGGVLNAAAKLVSGVMSARVILEG